jgi:hypothetical protein
MPNRQVLADSPRPRLLFSTAKGEAHDPAGIHPDLNPSAYAAIAGQAIATAFATVAVMTQAIRTAARGWRIFYDFLC